MVVETMEFTLNRRLVNFQQARNELQEVKAIMFPVPCVVMVDSGRFCGMGVVWRETADEGPAQLAVVLENGNTWSYPLEDCRRIDNEIQWPEWTKRLMTRSKP